LLGVVDWEILEEFWKTLDVIIVGGIVGFVHVKEEKY
jgi:hypothetical protein